MSDHRCFRCNRTDDLVIGDGPVVCNPCIDLLTSVADDPYEASPTLRAILQELHADVLVLVQPEQDKPDLMWRWVA